MLDYVKKQLIFHHLKTARYKILCGGGRRYYESPSFRKLNLLCGRKSADHQTELPTMFRKQSSDVAGTELRRCRHRFATLPAQSSGIASTELRRCRHRVATLSAQSCDVADTELRRCRHRVATLLAQSCGVASTELRRCRHRVAMLSA